MNWVIEYFVQALFDDDEVANSLESLAGTLKAAKRQERKYFLIFTKIQSTREEILTRIRFVFRRFPDWCRFFDWNVLFQEGQGKLWP